MSKHCGQVSELARVILRQLAQLYSQEIISQAEFENKWRRLEYEELVRRGLKLHPRDADAKRVSFEIRRRDTDEVVEEISISNFPPRVAWMNAAILKAANKA